MSDRMMPFKACDERGIDIGEQAVNIGHVTCFSTSERYSYTYIHLDDGKVLRSSEPLRVLMGRFNILGYHSDAAKGDSLK